MKRVSQKILDRLLQLKIDSTQKALDYFHGNEDLFLPDSQEKINEIIEGNLKEEDLLLRIINHDFTRPAIIIQDHSFYLSDENPWASILNHYRDNIQKCLRSVGIFEIQKRRTKVPSGTGWVLSEDLIVTNEHVAANFAKRQGGKYVMKTGCENLTIDFKEEFNREKEKEFKVLEVVHMEEADHNLYDHNPDIAILRVEKINKDGEKLPPPLIMYDGELKINQLISIIGFPSADYKMPISRKKIFKNIYDVKRLQPGLIKSVRTLYDFDFKHDCATLSGNSGSPIIDLHSGTVVGTHFAGSLNVFEGYAVRTDVLRKILTNLFNQ